jgi:hypothetical protein
MKSDYSYTNQITYNNFPWPDCRSGALAAKTADIINNENITPANRVEPAAQAVLDARALHPQSSLADLYDPLTMPANLLKAHQQLDKAVDAAYNYKGANTDAARVAFLFERYQAITSLLPAVLKTKKGKK